MIHFCLCDYATHYPEAVVLRLIDAEHIAEELVHIFACVGILDKILTDQEANSYQNYTKCFTSISYKQAPTLLKQTDSWNILIKLLL